MRLYLVQHGEAKPKEEDPDRHLTDRGRRQAERMAAFLEPRRLKVAAVWHSGKARAAETAAILAKALDSAQGIVQRDGLAPSDPIRPILAAVKSSRDDLMIVGHMPFLSRLASDLIAGDERADAVAFQYAGVVCIERGEEGEHRLRWMVTPDLLG